MPQMLKGYTSEARKNPQFCSNQLLSRSCRYQDYQASDIPAAKADGVRVRVMAGESLGVTGPIKMRNPGMLLDVSIAASGRFSQPVPEGWNGFAYVYDGAGRIGGERATAEHALVLGAGGHGLQVIRGSVRVLCS